MSTIDGISPNDILSLVQQHVAWYPLMQPRDVYKLLYQGMMGSEHLIASADEFSEYLAKEFSGLLPASEEILFEPIRPDGSLKRLNLRPYKSHFSGVEQLISPLLETARTFKSNISELVQAWQLFIQFCEQGKLNFDPDEVHQFNLRVVELSYPAAHHSEIYTNQYQPAYRLIAARFISALGLADAG